MTPEQRAKAIDRLRASGIDDPVHEVTRLWRASGQDVAVFDQWIARRARREPASHILGYRDFYNHRFRVTADVLDPRPETECLVRLALEAGFQRVLDLGTGSGCILLSLLAEVPHAKGLGSDVSPEALGIARLNAADLGLTDRASFASSNWFARITGQFDMIVSNPPYIAASEMADLAPEVRGFEPTGALTDGDDGLDAYRQIAAGVPEHLASGGTLMLEIGPTQAASVMEMLVASGLENVQTHPDLDGRDRVITARKTGF